MLTIIYRCCELETGQKIKRSCRPNWFSKENCLQNLLHQFPDTLIIAVHDGVEGPLASILKSSPNVEFEKINYNSNEKSLVRCLELGKEIHTQNVYFVEDDYLHRDGAKEVLLSGLNQFDIVTLYDHPDRYNRVDDIDFGKTHIYIDKFTHWRSAESTTCTWATRKNLYDEFIYKHAMSYRLQDRSLFRTLSQQELSKLHTPIPGYSTHCHEPFLSPIINWREVNDSTRSS